jgi:hypothetical protein
MVTSPVLLVAEIVGGAASGVVVGAVGGDSLLHPATSATDNARSRRATGARVRHAADEKRGGRGAGAGFLIILLKADIIDQP